MFDSDIDNINNNEINFNNIVEIDSKGFNNYIENKENEIKNILLEKLETLQTELDNYKKNNSELLSSLENLKFSNDNNLKLIREKDVDLKSYEYKFNNLSNNLREKDIEISNLNNKIQLMENILKHEKEEKTKNEEYNKYKINKQKMQHKEELNNMK